MDVNVEYDWVKNQKQLNHRVVKIDTNAFDENWPRTRFPHEGLHRPAGQFRVKDYTECFVQSVIQELHLSGKDLAVGGIGNKLSNKMVLKAVRVAAANGIRKVYAGKKGIMSRPAMSTLCMKHACWGLLIHPACNPVPDYNKEIIGIDVIHPDGGPIHPDKVITILATNQKICAYYIVQTISYSHVSQGHHQFFVGKRPFTVEVVDTVSEYVHNLKSVFDFDQIRELLSGVGLFRPFKVMIDCNGGAVGSYVKRLFVDELGVPSSSVVHCEPQENLKSFHRSHVSSMIKDNYLGDLSAYLDPDGSRCVVFGLRGFLVAPGETAAVMAQHHHAIPYFQKNEFAGTGRTFLTTSSVDGVDKPSLNVVKTPGNWLYLKRQMDIGRISFAEDDNFAIRSSHNPSSDGIWTILMWLTLDIHIFKPIHSIIIDHWIENGHHFMTFYEFHDIPKRDLDLLMKNLQYNIFSDPKFLGTLARIGDDDYEVLNAGNFPYCFTAGTEMLYEDSTLHIQFSPKSLIIFKSITAGDSGTLKIAVEVFSRTLPHTSVNHNVTKDLFTFAVKISLIGAITGKTEADLIY